MSSHSLHIYLLHAPDFLGLPDGIALANGHRDLLERGLRLKKAGNAILERVGGRAIHPVNPRIGGFHRAPTAAELAVLAEQLRPALDDALATVDWVAGFDFPDRELPGELLAAHHPDQYAIETGDVRSSGGLAFPATEFDDHVVEHQVAHSTALHATLDGRRYLTGPLARYSLNGAQLSPLAGRPQRPPGWGPSVATPSAASSCARWRSCTRWRRRCGSSGPTSAPSHPRSTCRPAPESPAA